MKLNVNDRINQCRHMILAIAGKSHEKGTDIQIVNLLKVLRRTSTGRIKAISEKLIKEELTYSNQEIWLFTIYWQLALDKEEMLTLTQL
jgi:hypothetical protein